MKNKDKYGNYDAALEAFKEMCLGQGQSCGVCPYSVDENPYYCELKWLYDEAGSSKDINTNNKELNNEE
jgi:hypothetical protein